MASLMPGETYGMPNGMGGVGGLLTNPALQIGLGILANNNTRNFGQVLGRGALQGLGNIQQQQAFQAQLAQQQQMAEFNRMRQRQIQSELDQEDKQRKALEGFNEKFPQYQGLADIDPKSALRIAYPELAKTQNSADPYFTPIATENGLVSFDNRTGKMIPLDVNGKPIVKSTDSPLVRGKVKEAEARATAGYNINTDIPGVVTTARQVAEQVNPALGYPQVTPKQQRGRDDKRMQILLQEQAQAGGAGKNPELDKEISNVGRQLGISIPTPAQAAAEKMKAEAQVKSQIDLPSIIQEAELSVKLVDDLLKAPGFKQAVGGSRLFGLQNIPGQPAKDFDIRLDQLKGKQFLQAFESLKGGGQITEVEGKKATDAISRMNPSASEEEFIKAAREFQDIIRKGAERAKAKAGGSSIMPSNEPMPSVQAVPLPAKPSTLTLKKGTVYQTPKGALRWNGKEFED